MSKNEISDDEAGRDQTTQDLFCVSELVLYAFVFDGEYALCGDP